MINCQVRRVGLPRARAFQRAGCCVNGINVMGEISAEHAVADVPTEEFGEIDLLELSFQGDGSFRQGP